MSFLKSRWRDPSENLFRAGCNDASWSVGRDFPEPVRCSQQFSAQSAPGIKCAPMLQYWQQTRQDGLPRKSVCKLTSEKNRNSTDLAPIIDAIANGLEILLLVRVEQTFGFVLLLKLVSLFRVVLASLVGHVIRRICFRLGSHVLKP